MRNNFKLLIRNFIIELVVYAVLVVLYFLLVLRTIGDWLTSLYDNDLVTYAVVALVLMVTQAVFLDSVTTFLIKRLGLDHLE